MYDVLVRRSLAETTHEGAIINAVHKHFAAILVSSPHKYACSLRYTYVHMYVRICICDRIRTSRQLTCTCEAHHYDNPYLAWSPLNTLLSSVSDSHQTLMNRKVNNYMCAHAYTYIYMFITMYIRIDKVSVYMLGSDGELKTEDYVQIHIHMYAYT